MKGIYTTDYGKIIIDTSVIAKMAGLKAIGCFGRNSLTKGIQVTIEQNEIVIDFHVIVAYGVSIKTISDNLVDAVTYQVESATGFKVKKINILVEGVRVID